MTELSTDGHGNLNRGASGQHRRTLDAIYQHPLAHNLEWREVVALMEFIGSATEKRDGEFSLRAENQTFSMKRPHGKDLEGPQVIELRRFLTRAGWSPDEAPTTAKEPASPYVIVVVEHHSAEIYQVAKPGDEASRQDASVKATKRILHEVDPKQADADREETYPDDERFFEAIASAIGHGPIVIISHGKGQSNEGAHLSAYLNKRHKSVAARVAQEIVADVQGMSPRELVQIGLKAME